MLTISVDLLQKIEHMKLFNEQLLIFYGQTCYIQKNGGDIKISGFASQEPDAPHQKIYYPIKDLRGGVMVKVQFQLSLSYGRSDC